MIEQAESRLNGRDPTNDGVLSEMMGYETAISREGN